MNLKRRLPQYLIGLLLMALGIVLVKKRKSASLRSVRSLRRFPI